MNFLKKTLVGAAAAFALAGSAHAGLVNVDGVFWNPNAASDFSGTSATIVQNIDKTSGVLSGFGVITTLNNTGVATFCPGCELTFQFGGYTPVSLQTTPTTADPAGTVISYIGGWLKIFVDHTPDADANDPDSLNAANATDGDLWLDLTAHTANGVTLSGQNNLNSAFQKALSGFGNFDVTGGLAAYNFDTNTGPDGSDIVFSSTFTRIVTTDGGVPTVSTGAATFGGKTIPEPGSMALVGLGLLAAGALRRRQASK